MAAAVAIAFAAPLALARLELGQSLGFGYGGPRPGGSGLAPLRRRPPTRRAARGPKAHSRDGPRRDADAPVERRARPLWRITCALGLQPLVIAFGRRVRPLRRRLKKAANGARKAAIERSLRFDRDWGRRRFSSFREHLVRASRSQRLAALLSRPRDPTLSISSVAQASLVFCFVVKSRPEVKRGPAFSHFNRRDSVVRSVLEALAAAPCADDQPTAAVLLFEDGSCWVLGAELLEHLRTPSEHCFLNHVWDSAEASRSAGGAAVGGVACLPPRGGAPARSLEAALFEFLRSLGGSPAGSALVFFGEDYGPLPLAAPPEVGAALPADGLRRAVCVLGCPAGVSLFAEQDMARAAWCAGWKVLRARLGEVSEFTSKITARLRLWHACGRLLPSLAQCTAVAEDETRLWPTQREWKPRDPPLCSGLYLHFVVPVAGPMSGITNNPDHELIGSFANAARCCIAALSRPLGAWRHCRISMCFDDGGAVSLTGMFMEKMRRYGQSATEFRLLGRLRESAKYGIRHFPKDEDEDVADAWPRSGRRGAPPYVVQRRLRLPYSREGSVLLRWPTAGTTPPTSQSPPQHGAPAADALVAALDAARARGGGAVVVDFAGVGEEVLPAAAVGEDSAELRAIPVQLRGVHHGNLTASISALQSCLFGHPPGGRRLLEELLLLPS